MQLPVASMALDVLVLASQTHILLTTELPNIIFKNFPEDEAVITNPENITS